MRLVPLILVVGAGLIHPVLAAWNPFTPPAPAPAAAKPQAQAAPAFDPFGDDLERAPLPMPAKAADPAGPNPPVALPPSGPGAVTPQYVTHGVWDRLLPGLFGPVPLGTTPYQGTEFHLPGTVFRPALFKYEGILLLLGAAYVVSVWLGRRSNKRRASSWTLDIFELLEAQFAKVEGLRSESSESYYIWATGRRNCRGGARVHIMLKPRGDVLLQAYEILRGIIEPTWSGASADRVAIEIGIEVGGDYVVGVADKAALSRLRQRWDLATFAPVNESNLLPPAYCVMAETGSLQEALLRSGELGLTALLESSTSSQPMLESVLISDIGETQPSEATLLSDVPLPKKRQIAVTFPLRGDVDSKAMIVLALNLVDLLGKGKPTLPDGAAAKVAKRRADIVAGLKRPLLEEQREEKDAKLREVKRKAEQSRQAALTPKQLEKEEAQRRKREQRKSQGKMVRRG